ncbi:hypothetical protein K4G94_22015, partial [Mycobacterium tuberculosis]|uniref:hypothetical protein n=1 Tax=Mycobacterium tuberculosis TaxID=1773 RepID=UPI001C7C9F49|nr:hypothetical protein [Mycobacterium tuberculosis]
EKYPLYYNKNAKAINKKIDNLNKEFKTLHNPNEGIFYIYNDDLSSTNKQLPENLTVDGLHLNKNGYEIWVDSIKSIIK